MTSRLEKVKKLLQLDALMIENPIDLFYLTGMHFSVGKLIIRPDQIFLIIDGRYYEQAKANGPLAGQVTILLDSETALKNALKAGDRVGFDGATLAWDGAEKLFKNFPDIHFTSLSYPLKDLRAVKEPDEIKKMKKAAKLGSEGFDFLLTQLKEGISEKELAAKLQLFWLERGGQGVAFEPIIAFGANSALPHYRAGLTRLKKGDTVLLDIGVILDDYHSDMTRTQFFGEPPAQMKEIYLIVKEAHEKAAQALKRASAQGSSMASPGRPSKKKGMAKTTPMDLGMA